MRSLLFLSLALMFACGRVAFDPVVADSGTTPIDADTCTVPGLLAAWSMNSADVTGTTVLDRSGNGRDGTLVGSPPPTLSAGHVAEALDFTGTTLAYMSVPSLPLDSTAGAFTTVSLWFRSDDPTVDQGVFCLPTGPVAGAPRYCMWLTKQSGPLTLCINTGNGECWGFADNGLIGRWVHVAAIYANGPTTGGSFFIDGSAATMSCVFGACNQTRVAQPPFEVGNSDSTYAWRGRVDDVRVFARALGASEVVQLIGCAR